MNASPRRIRPGHAASALSAFCLLLCGGLAASTSQAAIDLPTTTGGSVLFVQTAQQGQLERARGGRMTLTLQVSPWTHAFTDRPGRYAGRERTSRFVRAWGNRFRGDPPNAALSRDEDQRLDIVELRRPRLTDGALRYTVLPLKGASGGKLRHGRFGGATLFIDNISLESMPGMLCNFNGECEPGDTQKPMIVVFETPAYYEGTFEVTLNGDGAFFDQNQPSGGYSGTQFNSNTSVSVNVGFGNSFPTYHPVQIQGDGQFSLTTSIPLQVSPDNYSYVPIGPDQPVTYEFSD